MKARALATVLTAAIFMASCNGSSGAPPISDVIEPVNARVIVTDLTLSADEKTVDSITVRSEDEIELTLRLGTDINPTTWGPAHIRGHIETGKAFGFTIGVKYVETSEGMVIIELSE